MFKPRRLRCSFCGKGEAEVEKLVAGPRVFICDACVAIASRMMNGPRGRDDDAPPRARQSAWRRVSACARRYLRGEGSRRVADARSL